MNPTRWQRIQELVELAANLAPSERAAFLKSEVNDDLVLREQIGAMLEGWEAPDVFEEAIGRAALHCAAGQLLAPGDRLGPWRILSLIGHGGMGSVYQAERADDQFRQQAAVKVVRIGPGAPDELLLRFRSERQILADISHPNIARLLDGGFTASGLPYLVMEYVEGENLDRYIERAQPPLADRLLLMQQICAAVQHAHRNLIVHRDLKPSNILVSADGRPRLLDFGIAKLLDSTDTNSAVHTRQTDRLMTPEYASPEQVRGELITTSSDVYSLGVLLYEVLTGTRPFEFKQLSSAEVERFVTEVQPRPPSTYLAPRSSKGIFKVAGSRLRIHDLDRIVLKSMHKQPERRYLSASDLSSDLQRYLDGFPVQARPDSAVYRLRLFIDRHRLAVGAALLFFIVVLSLSVISSVLAARARREAAAADSVSAFLSGLFQQARPDNTRGRDLTAHELLNAGAERLQGTTIKDPIVRARLLGTLGRVYFDIGDMNHAAPLLLQAEALHQQHPKSAPLQFAEIENALGTLELDQNAPSAAAHYQKALTLLQVLKGDNSPEVADVLDSLGEVEGSLGHLDRAEQLLERSIQIHSRTVGVEAEATLTDKHNLASIYSRLGDYQRQQSLLSDVLAAHRRTVGDLQEITTSDLGNLAWLEDRLGHFDRAETLSHEVITLKSKLFGAENPRLAMQYLVLGDVLRQTYRFEEARSAVERSLRMARQFDGPNSMHSAWDEDELGLIALAQGRFPEARNHLTSALHIRQAQVPPPLQDLALSFDNLGQLETAEHNTTTAEQHLRHALELEHLVFPHPNDSIASTENHLGQALASSGRQSEACALFHDALKIADLSFSGEQHPTSQAAKAGLAKANCPR